jgi:hypothetical protein
VQNGVKLCEAGIDEMLLPAIRPSPERCKQPLTKTMIMLTSKLFNMKKNFFPLNFFLMLLYLCSCNNSNTDKTQNQAGTQTEIKSIFINGDSIHYIDIGKGDPVVFVHGAFGDYRTWRRNWIRLLNTIE